MTAKKRVFNFMRKEPVFLISFICAVISSFWVHPSLEYLDYIDFRVLCLLFCLMAAVAGFREAGIFKVFAQKLLSGKRLARTITVLLVMMPFFCSMLVTNDVALITFVPFSILVLETVGRRELLIPVISLQTIAANLGSMATPIGNPQNLFLFAHYQLTINDFLLLLIPLTLVSFIVLVAACLCFGGKGFIHMEFDFDETISDHKRLLVYIILFLLCILSVSRILSYIILTAVVIAALLFVRPKLLKEVDYMLLLTFVCFFVFSGNLGKIESIRSVLTTMMENSTLFCSAAASQIISNVPAAVLLADITNDWKGLLLGVDVGGLGTPVASLASLISLKFYFASENARPASYLLWFTLANIIGLIILLPISLYMSQL